jgi:hypothetical protein
LDVGNAPPGTDLVPVAGIASASVTLFVARPSQGGEPLVIDSDGDGVCDDIAPEFDPARTDVNPPMSAQKARSYSLIELAAGGEADFRPEAPPPTGCATGSVVGEGPEPLCRTTSLTRILETAVGTDGDSFIWSIPPALTGQPLGCEGRQLDSLSAGFLDGDASPWLCVAVRAVDKLGNVGVSAPIRVCLDQDQSQLSNAANHPPCGTIFGEPPACRIGCKARRVVNGEKRFMPIHLPMRGVSHCLDDGSRRCP